MSPPSPTHVQFAPPALDESSQPDQELRRIGITIHQAPCFPNQLGIAVFGQLGPFIFIRHYQYWLAKGLVPLFVAEEMYLDPIGRTDVRVVDHTWDPVPPITAVIYRDSDGKRLVAACLEEVFGLMGKNYSPPPDTRIVINPAAEGQPFIEHFFITSEVGLRLFVDTLRKHNLV